MDKARQVSVKLRTAGFTLIELMIAVVVLGILVAIAFPSFMDQIRKSRRSDAVQAINAIQQAQERRRANQAAYTADLTGAVPAGLAMTSASAGGYYAQSIDAADAISYRILATAVSGKSQAGDGSCVVMSIRMATGNIFYGSGADVGSISEAPGNRCWARQ